MDSDFREDLLQKYSDAELVHHVRASPRLEQLSSISLLSPTLLAKHYQSDSVEDMVKATDVARQLGIHVPEIKRIVTYKGGAFCIMEAIPGPTLEETWKELGWFTTIKLALQLRHSVRRLRSVTSSTAGSLATGECRSFYLEDRFGLPARARPEHMASFLRFWTHFKGMRSAIAAATQPLVVDPKIRIPPVALPFVFTHHDLAPRNILVIDSSTQLCLLDWDLAGFYPIYFEYASMQNFQVPQDWNMFARLRWKIFSWIAVGRYEQDARVLAQIRSRFTRFAVGRRFELLARGGPSNRPVSSLK